MDQALEEAGFETEVIDPNWLARARRGEIFADIIHAFLGTSRLGVALDEEVPR